MNATTIIVIAVIVAILGGAIFYIVRAKKKGVKCIGCPAGSSCSGHCCSGSKPTTSEAEPVQAEAAQPAKVDIALTTDNKANGHTCDCSSCTSCCPSNNTTEED